MQRCSQAALLPCYIAALDAAFFVIDFANG
jgi:hypothetical protein